MKLAICVPCRDHVSAQAFAAITKSVICAQTYWKKQYGDRAQFVFISSFRTHIHIARWGMMQRVMEANPDYLLWLDDDAIPTPDIVEDMHRHDKDMVVPLFCTRTIPARNVAGCIVVENRMRDGEMTPHLVRAPLPPLGKDLVRIGVTGFHCVFMKRKVVDAVLQATGGASPFIFQRGERKTLGEDVSFFQLAFMAGCELWLDPTVEVGHVGEYIYTMKDVPEDL